jgi:hypothetical protein
VSSKLSLLALGLGVYLTAAIVSFPASLAHRWFAPDALALAVVEGTIWRGSAAHGAVKGFAFADLEWQLEPLALLTGKLSVTTEAALPTGFASAHVVASGDRLELTDISAATSLETFASLLPLGEASGQISLGFERIEFVDGWPTAAVGEARVGNLSVPPLFAMAGVTSVVLGNFRAQFTGEQTPDIVALVSDEGGPLELTGSISLAPDRTYTIDTLIRPRAESSQVLRDGIDMIGAPPNAEGMRKIVLSGSL